VSFGAFTGRKRFISLFDDPAEKGSATDDSATQDDPPPIDPYEAQKPFGHPGLVFVIILTLPTLYLALTYLLARNLGPHAVAGALVLAFALYTVPAITIASTIIQAVFTLCTSWRLRRDGALVRRIVVAVNVIVVGLLLFALQGTAQQLGLH
jgi:hypothetical protein